MVVRKTEQQEWRLFPSALSTFSFNLQDEARAQALWRRGQWDIKESPNVNLNRSFTLAEMSAMSDSDEDILKDRDTTVMVAGIFPYPEMPTGVNPCGLLRIWDGTGIPPNDP